MILNEFEAVTNLDNGPIIFTYYAQSELLRSSLHYIYLGCTLSNKRKSRECKTICEWGSLLSALVVILFVVTFFLAVGVK